jgi:hypothetical protein
MLLRVLCPLCGINVSRLAVSIAAALYCMPDLHRRYSLKLTRLTPRCPRAHARTQIPVPEFAITPAHTPGQDSIGTRPHPSVALPAAAAAGRTDHVSGTLDRHDSVCLPRKLASNITDVGLTRRYITTHNARAMYSAPRPCHLSGVGTHAPATRSYS